jgi:hypothetical protein
MSPYRSALRHLALTSAIVVLPVASAHALDTEAFGTRLKAVVAQQGGEIAWTGINENGSQIVLSGVTVGGAGKPDDQKGHLGDVTLDNVTEENGGYKIGTVSFQDFTSPEEDGMTVALAGASISGLTLPAENATDAMSAMMMYESAKLDTFSVNKAGKEVFGLQNLHAEITPPADGKALEFTGAADSFTADLSQTEDPQSKAVIEALGYQNIKGSLAMAGSWQPSDGHIGLSQYDITVDNAGTLGVTFDLGGYTTDFVKQLQALQKQMATQPAGSDNSALGMQVLGMMQQLTFGSASIRWDDDSLTQKVLEFVAKSNGQKPEDIANQAKAMVPFLMAQLNNPELTTQVTEAVNAYLAEPKSIEISAEPEKEVPFAVLMAGGMGGNPAELLKTLAVSVSANQDQ